MGNDQEYSEISCRLASLGQEKWEMYFQARKLLEKGYEILDLTIGEPDIPADSNLVENTVHSLYSGRTKYSYGRGEPIVLEAIADKYTKRTGRTITAENVVHFPGTQTALFATMMTLARSEYAVATADPYYATYEGIVAATGASFLPVPLRADAGFQLHPHDLEQSLNDNCRILLLNNPHNPTGSVLDKKTVQGICDFCAENDIWIVADEVYEHLVFDGAMHSPFDIDHYAEKVVVVSSISKSHAAPGFRSGWAVGPVQFCRQLLPLAKTMLFGNVQFIADGTAAILNEQYTTASTMRNTYASRAGLVANEFTGLAGVIPFMPRSGMFMLIDASRTGLTGEQFAWRLLKTKGVAVMPGSSFGKQAVNYIRLSLTVDEDILVKASRHIVNLIISLSNC